MAKTLARPHPFGGPGGSGWWQDADNRLSRVADADADALRQILALDGDCPAGCNPLQKTVRQAAERRLRQLEKAAPAPAEPPALLADTAAPTAPPPIPAGMVFSAGAPQHPTPAARAFDLIDIRHVIRSDFNPRTHFDAAKLKELAASIQQHGILEPLVVRPIPVEVHPDYRKPVWHVVSPRHLEKNGSLARYDTVEEAEANQYGFEIVAGERRYRAAKLAGLTHVPCVLRSLTDREAVEIAVTENLQRTDLDPFEEARGFRLLLDLPGATQQAVAEKLGCSQSHIAKRIGLMRLPEAVQAHIRADNLSVKHGVALLPYADYPDLCTALARSCIKNGITAAKLEAGLNYESLADVPDRLYRYLGIGSTRFNWSAVCPKSCPHNAYRRGQGNGHNGYCIHPVHFEELNAEADAERRKQTLETANLRRQNFLAAKKLSGESEAGGEAPGAQETECDDGAEDEPAETIAPTTTARQAEIALPQLANMRAESIIRLDQGQNGRGKNPKACDKSCPCRSVALDPRGERVGICTDPKRYKALAKEQEDAEEAARKERQAARLEKALRRLDDPEDTAVVSLATVIVFAKVTNSGFGGYSYTARHRMAEALQRRGLEIAANDLILGYREPLHKSPGFATLAGCDVGVVLRLTAEVLVREEVANTSRNNDATPLLDFLLNPLAAVEATAAPETVVAGSEEVPHGR